MKLNMRKETPYQKAERMMSMYLHEVAGIKDTEFKKWDAKYKSDITKCMDKMTKEELIKFKESI